MNKQETLNTSKGRNVRNSHYGNECVCCDCWLWAYCRRAKGSAFCPPPVIYVIDGNDVGNQSQKPIGVLARRRTFEYLADDTDRPASNNWALGAWTESADVDRAWGQSSRSATNVSDKATRQPITAARWRSSMNVSGWHYYECVSER